ncbi:cytochrome c peroxidase [Kordia algicida OT-1]|uniref:Possible cytochrome C peroxidase n=1 Tax=Kordia algicida OT-1 TaxID=391587 RepID=A9DXS8_9FLAO|nr:cytochrome c peroxidase [Kordia algicida]EDP96041.1 possible cytochrome C peroxidase [Kordia algicida OT-1]
METTPISTNTSETITAAIKAQFATDLSNCIHNIDALRKATTKDSILYYFKASRLDFKRMEPILSFYNSANYYGLNKANLPKVDEGDNAEKTIEASGFQALEEAIAAAEFDINTIHAYANDIYSKLKLEQKHNSILKHTDYKFLWLTRQALVRVMSLGISGFDSPVLLQSIPENKEVFLSLESYFKLYESHFNNKQLYKNWISALQEAQKSFETAENFDTFDRYDFIKNKLQPMLSLWNQTVTDWQVEFPLQQKLNYNVNSFYDANTFNSNAFKPSYSPKVSPEIAQLGKDLFFDTSLSSSETMNCASCHQPEKAFADGLRFSKDNNGNFVQRNAPTLLYASLQQSQFYDARVENLENQILDVITNKNEFHTNTDIIITKLEQNPIYKKRFETLYKRGINHKTVRNAIATYIRTLTPFNSKFDRNISGKEDTFTTEETLGFNLFMGKGKCATCHFAPVFNGTVPPYFTESELEVLGIPATKTWENATVDSDVGRYTVAKAKLKTYAFKTPTVRNISKTAPYMHNGVYETLEEVLKFYNLGGGSGIGIELENQTLPPDPLQLSDKEIKAIIAFMNSLEDQLEENL